jgi:hypothetical protein
MEPSTVTGYTTAIKDYYQKEKDGQEKQRSNWRAFSMDTGSDITDIKESQ